jgi:hypothetical protein
LGAATPSVTITSVKGQEEKCVRKLALKASPSDRVSHHNKEHREKQIGVDV